MLFALYVGLYSRYSQWWAVGYVIICTLHTLLLESNLTVEFTISTRPITPSNHEAGWWGRNGRDTKSVISVINCEGISSVDSCLHFAVSGSVQGYLRLAFAASQQAHLRGCNGGVLPCCWPWLWLATRGGYYKVGVGFEPSHPHLHPSPLGNDRLPETT